MPIIKVNDIDLYYETYGQGEPLVFISGFTSDHSLWQPVLSGFTDKYQVGFSTRAYHRTFLWQLCRADPGS
jgi:pimeloyl-ACP methyl ester carboxylesterase